MKRKLGEGAHQQVLDLVAAMETEDGPVEHERMQWEVDYGESAEDFADNLGPRPRRATLLTVLGDLIDHRLVEIDPSLKGLRAKANQAVPMENCPFIEEVNIGGWRSPLDNIIF